jgi:hypothetical protein
MSESGALAVRFYSKEVQNDFLTNKEGRPISYMADFVRIEVPGNQTSIIETFVNNGHKARFPQQWAIYLNEKADGNNNPDNVQGTILRDWPILNAAQATELKHFKFYTVEQVAAASDQQIMAIGMTAGMSPLALRDKAIAFLENAKDSSFAQRQSEELKLREQEIADLKEQMTRLAKMVEAKSKSDEKTEVKSETKEPKKD